MVVAVGMYGGETLFYGSKKNNNSAVVQNQIQISHSFLLKAAVNDLQ